MTKARQLAVGDQNPHNYLINGGFDIWQRGTTQTSNGYGSDDRWKNTNAGSTKSHSRQAFTLGQTDVPGEPEFYSRTVVSSVTGATNGASKEQRIEDVRTLAGKTATVTFYAKADAAKDVAVNAEQYFGTGGSPSASVYVAPQKVSLTTAWQKFSLTFAVPSIAGKTLGTNGDGFLKLSFWFDAGSDFNAQTDSLGHQSGTFDIARVSVCEGNVTALVDPFEDRSAGEELALCQRYLRKVYVFSFVGVIYTPNGDMRMTPISYGAMRATPSVSPATFTSDSINFSENGTGVNTPTIVWNASAYGNADLEGSLAFGYSSGTLSAFGGTGNVATLGSHVFTTFSLDAEL